MFQWEPLKHDGALSISPFVRDEDFHQTLSMAAAITNASVFKSISSCDGSCTEADIFLILHSAPSSLSASDVL